MKEKAMEKKTSNSRYRLAVKEQRLIPNMVFKMEQFDNSLIKLSKNYKFDFSLKPSTSRDFRYRAPDNTEDNGGGGEEEEVK
jgi:hypothetical protein